MEVDTLDVLGEVMSKLYIIPNSNDYQPGIRKKAIKREVIIGPTAIKFVTIAIVAVLFIIYLTQSTANASRSIKVRDAADQKSNYEEIQTRLEDEKTRLESLNRINQETEKVQMEPVSSVDHLQAGDRDLARN